jgi:hypothetical protein
MKFLVLWEVNTASLPDDPKEHPAIYANSLNMIKDDLKNGIIKDWGGFAGEAGFRGYFIIEVKTEEDLYVELTKYVPYKKFRSYPIVSVDQEIERVKALSQA